MFKANSKNFRKMYLSGIFVIDFEQVYRLDTFLLLKKKNNFLVNSEWVFGII